VLSISNDVRAIGVVTEGRLTFESHIAAVVKCCNMAAKILQRPQRALQYFHRATRLARTWES